MCACVCIYTHVYTAWSHRSMARIRGPGADRGSEAAVTSWVTSRVRICYTNRTLYYAHNIL